MDNVRLMGDGAIVTLGFTAPWWVNLFESWAHVYMWAGGAILLTLRIAIAWREWRRRKQ